MRTLAIASVLVLTLVACSSADPTPAEVHLSDGVSTQSHHCGKGIRSCSATEVGQPCDPNNLSVVCSAQANGSYCCLAVAP